MGKRKPRLRLLRRDLARLGMEQREMERGREGRRDGQREREGERETENVMREGCSDTYPHLSIARCSFIQPSELKLSEKDCPRF